MPVLAQLEGATPTTIVGAFILVAVTLAGLVGWIVRHVFVTTIPALVTTFEKTIGVLSASADANQAGLRAEQTAQREEFRAGLDRVLATAQAEGAAERKICADQFALLNSALVGLTASIREEREAVAATVNNHTTQQCSAYRHDLHNAIQQAVMGREAARLARDRQAAAGSFQGG